MSRPNASRRGRRILVTAVTLAGLMLAAASVTLGGSGMRPSAGTSTASGAQPAMARPPTRPAAAAPATYNPAAVTLTLTPVASGFSSPVQVTNAGDGSGRLFVVEQTGKIRVIKGGVVLAAPFLDLSPSISHGGEQGLLGLAFHPAYKTNGKFYVYLTLANGDIAINEYRRTTLADRVDWRTGRRIMTIAHHTFSNHNGGGIAFGRDGYLYIGVGDGGSGGDPNNNAQNLSSLLGKLLRIDVNGRTATRGYRTPASNPYVGVRGFDEIWSWGLRNPWRWSFDRTTGALWIGDVGQGSWEEIDRSTNTFPGRGSNFGWRVMEGRHCYNPSSGCGTARKVLPVVEYGHTGGSCSVTGGYVYRGAAQPILQGGYFFADFCSGRIWTISAVAASPASPVLLLDTGLNISSFGEDQAGEVYVVDLNGGIYRIVGS
jgi:glucose/arabinose dehydrogenase